MIDTPTCLTEIRPFATKSLTHTHPRAYFPYNSLAQVAENRYDLLGKRDTCRLPDPGDDRFLA